MTHDSRHRTGCTYVINQATGAMCSRVYTPRLWLVWYGEGTGRMVVDDPIVRCGAHLAATVGAFAANDYDVGFLDRVEPAQ